MCDYAQSDSWSNFERVVLDGEVIHSKVYRAAKGDTRANIGTTQLIREIDDL